MGNMDKRPAIRPVISQGYINALLERSRAIMEHAEAVIAHAEACLSERGHGRVVPMNEWMGETPGK